MTSPIPFEPTPAERMAELREADKRYESPRPQLYERTVQFAEPPTLRRSLREGCIDALIAVVLVVVLVVVVGVFS